LAGRFTSGEKKTEDVRKKNGALAELRLPDLCEPSPDAQIVPREDRKYFSKIVAVPEDGTRIPFLLIPKDRGSDPDTFYMMEDKVSVELFLKFDAKVNARNDRWKNGALADRKPLGIADGQLPVMGVTVRDALRFARWLGGDLPSIQQWDKAAGANEPNRGEGPYVAPWDKASKTQVAVNRGGEGPMRVGEAAGDVSPFGCRDMAGNGLEWTRSLMDVIRNNRVTLDYKSTLDDRVLLRGRSYAMPPWPLRYSEMQQERTIDSLQYDETNPFTGFRVVLEP
jgi:formylglycine-generating enzyme required for sulfatase activity